MVILYGRGFIVRPKSVLRSNSCPGTFSIRSLWSSVVRKTNISKRANPSPRQRLFPMPKMRTFSVSSLLRMSDDPRKRSGRNVSGSPQRSLETKAENKYLSMKKKILKVTDTIPSLHKQAEIIIWWRLFCGNSHIMINLILVNEHTCIFGNEISIQGDVSRGTEGEKNTQKF